MESLDRLRRHYEDRLLAARIWKADGGRVVGYLCDNVPVELIEAAGFLPLRLSGDPAGGLAAVRRHVDVLYPPDVTARPEFAASILNELLEGRYDVLDYLVIPHNRNAIQAMFRELRDARREEPGLALPELHYLDKAWSPSYVSEVYNRNCVVAFKATLEAWSGTPIAEDALGAAIAEGNENRALLAQVAGLRAASPPRLSGVDALAIIGTSMVMRRADHNALLKAFLAEAPRLQARTGPRVFVGGSPLDHPAVYAAIEATGATVVAEDHCWGNRSFDLPVDGDAGPLLNLAARFHLKPACSITFPIGETQRACARRAAAALADAAIFYVMEEDWAQNWETPGEVSLLQARGVPVLHLKGRPYGGGDLAALEAEVREFVNGLEPVEAGA